MLLFLCIFQMFNESVSTIVHMQHHEGLQADHRIENVGVAKAFSLTNFSFF